MALEHAVSHRHEYDITPTYKVNEPAQLTFKILTKDNVDAYKIGQVIEYENKVFLVDKLDIDRDDYSITTVTCYQNAINLSKKYCGSFEYISETVQTLADAVLEGTGWSLGRTDIPSNMKRHLITEEQTVLANLNTIAENFGAVLIFNYNTVDILIQKGEELILSDDVNLESISISKDGADIITRLHCFGGVDKDTGIETSILDMTNGLTYIEDYSFFLEQGYSLAFIKSRPDLFLREAIYRNTDLYDSQALYNAGTTQLKAQMYPQVTCKVNVINNGKPIHINMSAQIYDSETETHLSARVTEVTVNKDEPAVFQVELSNVVSYGSWVSDVITKVDKIDSVVNDVSKSWQEILEEAKNNATNLINENLSKGHVCVEKNAIFIGDQPEKENMKNVWILGLGGIGHSSTGVGGQVNVAMTMDGAIVADRITAGELNGAIIKAGSIKADALSVETYEKFQQGINIGATNYIRNSGNFKDSAYWLGNVTCRETLLNCSREVRNITNIPLMGGEEYIYSATLITEKDITITEDNLILGYVAYQPTGVLQTRAVNEDVTSKEPPVIITTSKTYEVTEGNSISIGFESSKNLKSLKLSINNGKDFNYIGTISGQKVTFKTSHLVWGNYTCQLVGEDEHGNVGYTNTFIVNIVTPRKNNTIFSNISIAPPYEIKKNTLTRIFLKYKTRDDLNNGFIINPTISINGNYKIKNVQWEKGSIASDWKPNILDVSDGTLNEAKTYFNVESGKIIGRVEEIEKNYASNSEIDDKINDAKNDINEQIKDVNNQLGKLEEDMDNISLDGIIDEVELKLIAENIAQLNKEKEDVDVRFNNLYNSILLTGEAKTNLNQAKNLFDLKHTQLLNKINKIIEDNLLDESEMIEFKRAVQQYQSALALLSKAFDDAIANIAENVANNYTNEKFSELKLELDKISLSVGNVTSSLADYKKTTNERISKIEMTANSINMSVSKVEKSVNLIQNSQAELEQAQNTLKNNLNNKVSDVNNSLNSFQNTVNTTFKDGIIDKAEALALEKQIKLLNIEKSDIDNMYTSIYTNSDLTGTAKSNLYTAKNNYNSAHTGLINAINNAIRDNKITSSEQTTVNNSFSTYSSALSNYSTKHNEALNAIAEKKKQDSISYTNTKMAEINITPDAIISTVTNSQKYKNDLNGKISQTDLNSAIKQSANQIKHEVSQIYPTNESVSNSFSNLDRNLQSTYATKTLVNQTANSITQTVSKKVGKDEIISSINQTAESVKISASKFEIDGTTLLNGQMKMLPSSGSTNYASLYAIRNGNGVNMRVQLGGTQQDGCFEIVSGSEAKYFWVNYYGAHSSNYHYFHTDSSHVGYNVDCLLENGCFRPMVDNKGYLGTQSRYWNQSWITNMYSRTLTTSSDVAIGGNINLSGSLTARYGNINGNYIGSYGNIMANGTVKGNYLESTGSAKIASNLQVDNTATIKSTVYIGGSLEVKSYGTTLKELEVTSTTTLKGYTVIKNNSLGVEGSIYCNGNIEALQSGRGQINCNYLGSMGNIACRGTLSGSNLSISGSKNCVQDTENYGKRLVNAYETADYYFGDLGESKIEDGECIVYLDDIFKETISTDYEYQVFITKYGKGDIWVSKRHQDYFVVQAENDIQFGWEIKGKRKGYENYRLVEYKEESEIDKNE